MNPVKKDILVDKAFEVFILKGYESTALDDLYEFCELSQKDFIKYFRNKDDIFLNIIDKFILDLFKRMKTELKDTMALPEMISRYANIMKKHYKNVCVKSNYQVTLLKYNDLSSYAAKIYPGFEDIINDIKSMKNHLWKNAVRNSIERGEVRRDIDITIVANVFCNIASDFEYARISSHMFETCQIEKTMIYFYNLLRPWNS